MTNTVLKNFTQAATLAGALLGGNTALAQTACPPNAQQALQRAAAGANGYTALSTNLSGLLTNAPGWTAPAPSQEYSAAVPAALRSAERCLASLLTALPQGVRDEQRDLGLLRTYAVNVLGDASTPLTNDDITSDASQIRGLAQGRVIFLFPALQGRHGVLTAIEYMRTHTEWTLPAEANPGDAAEPAVAAPAAPAETPLLPQFTTEEMDNIVGLVNRILTTLNELHTKGVLPESHEELVNKIKDILAFVNRANANQPRLETALNELNNMKKELKAEQTRTRTGLFIALVLLTFVILVRQKQLSNRRQAELSGIQAELKEIRQAIADLPAEIKAQLKGTLASNLPPIVQTVRAGGAVPPQDPLAAAAASALTPGSGSSTSGGPPI